MSADGTRMFLDRILSEVLPRRAVTPRELGLMGERRAVWFFRWRGYAILARNLREREGEIDLLVRRGRKVAFVEVKARQSRVAGAPFEAVDLRKQQRIGEVAARVARRVGVEQLDLRFDVLSLYWNGRRFEVQHFPGAFELTTRPGRPWLPPLR